MITSLHKYLYFSTEIHPRLLLVAIFKYPDNTQERGIKPKRVTLSLKNVLFWFGLSCLSLFYHKLLSIVTTLPQSHSRARPLCIRSIVSPCYSRKGFPVQVNNNNNNKSLLSTLNNKRV